MGENANAKAKATWSLACLALAFLGCLFWVGQAEAAGIVGTRAASRATSDISATDVRLESSAESTRLIFDLSAAVEARAFPIARPDRIVVDLPEIAFHIPPLLAHPLAGRNGRDAGPTPFGLITSYRFGQFARGHSRIIIDLSAPARIVRTEIQPAGPTTPARLVIELAPTDRQRFERAVAAADMFGLPAKMPQPAPAVVFGGIIQAGDRS